MDMLRLYARTLKVVEPIAEANQHKAHVGHVGHVPVNMATGLLTVLHPCPRYLWTSWAES